VRSTHARVCACVARGALTLLACALVPVRAADAAFHHGKVGDGPLIRSRVKLLEAVRLLS
jgi:hypothetical protein